MRWLQTWTCLKCGHASTREVRYAKLFGGYRAETPLTVWAARGRCTKCGTRGQCRITETSLTPGWGARQ